MPAVDPALLLDAVGLELHEVVVAAEHVLVPARHLLGLGVVARGEELAHLRVEAAREHEQPVGVLGEELAVHTGLVVEALEVGLGHELDQVAVAGLVAHQHRGMAGALVAAVLARSLEPAARRHVELAAHDGLDPRLLGGAVEVHRPEEIAVVGERDGGERELLGLLHQPLELGGAVEQAVLGVDVQVDEVPPLSGLTRLAPLGTHYLSARLACGGGSPIDGSARLADGCGSPIIPTRWCSEAWRRCRRRRG